MVSSSALRLIAAIEDAWVPFRQAVDDLGEERFDESTSAGWTVKQMLAHIAFWEEAVEGYMTLEARMRPLPPFWSFGSGYMPEAPWPSARVHNEREAEWASDRSAEEVIRRLDRAHEDLIAVYVTISEAEAEKYAAYFEEQPNHLREHLPELLTLLGVDAGAGQ